jgi:hypothetical protein
MIDDFWAESSDVYAAATDALLAATVDPTVYLLGEDGIG